MNLELQPRKERILRYGRIGFDLDEVLARTIDRVNRELTTKTGVKFSREDVTTWGYILKTEKLNHLSQAERTELDELWITPRMFREARPVLGALWAVKALCGLGAEMYSVSGRYPTSKEVTFAWFREFLSQFPKERIFLPDYHTTGLNARREFKVAKVGELKLEAFIEDDPKVVVALAQRTPAKIFLVKYPWNEAVVKFLERNPHPSIIPVDGWVETYQILTSAKPLPSYGV